MVLQRAAHEKEDAELKAAKAERERQLYFMQAREGSEQECIQEGEEEEEEEEEEEVRDTAGAALHGWAAGTYTRSHFRSS